MPPCRILIVEDDEAIRNLVRVAANRWGYKTEMCSGGDDAIGRLGELGGCDVLVLDLMMPVTSGYDVIDYIREKHLNVPVVVVTAVVRGLQEDRLDPDIVKAILRKPFDLDTLCDAIELACHSTVEPRRERAGPGPTS